jgi:hypothetical protein
MPFADDMKNYISEEKPKQKIQKKSIENKKVEQLTEQTTFSETVDLNNVLKEIIHVLNEQKQQILELKNEKEKQPIYINISNPQQKQKSIVVKRDDKGNMIGAEVVETDIPTGTENNKE